jgi:hypothetical protein
MDFDIDADGFLHLYDAMTGRILKYSAKGEYVGELEQDEFFFNSIAVLDKDHFISCQGRRPNKDNNFNLMIWSPEGIDHRYFPYENVKKKHYRYFKNLDMYRSGSAILFSESNCDTIYEATAAGMKAKYFFDFGDYTLPDKRRQNMKTDPAELLKMEYGWCIDHCFETPDYFASTFFMNKKLWHLYYHKASGKALLATPPSINHAGVAGNLAPIGVFNDQFIGLLDQDLITVIKKIPGNPHTDLIQSISDTDNPILILYRLKTI